MNDFLFDLLQHQEAETLYLCQDKASGLKAMVAIHDTTLGPAAGGIRLGAMPQNMTPCQMLCAWHEP